MYRQYSSRNQRNKGIKVKHALQICALLAVCFWLIYQVKHSLDENKGFEESDEKDPLDRGSIGGFIKIRRKDIRPIQEIVTADDQHNQVAEEDEIIEIENDHEEDRSPDKKIEEYNEPLRDEDNKTDEHGIEKSDTEVDQGEDNKPSRDGDDKTDEHEIEQSGTEVDQEEDNTNDVAREDGIDNETEGDASEDVIGMRQENSAEDRGHDGGDENNHEADEELYKADDASRAVTHDNHTQTAENENKFVRISDHLHENIMEPENNENRGGEASNSEIKQWLVVDNGKKSEEANWSNTTDIATNLTISETKESNLESSEKDSSLNSTLTEAYSDNLEAGNSSTNVTTQDPKLPEENVTESVPELDHNQRVVAEGASTEGSNSKTIILEQANSSTLDMENHLLNSDSTDHAESINSESDLEDFSKPFNDTDSFTDTESFTVVRITRTEHHSLGDGANTNKNETMPANLVSSNGKNEVLY